MTTTPFRAEWRSPAKVNLCLRVVGRRADGYHLLDSIFVAIDLCDRIGVEVDDLRAAGESTVELQCGYPGVPEDASNLAARAARAVLAEAGRAGRVRLRLDKVIPPGTGLGGGSGNAATVLAGLNALLALAVPSARLHAIALGLGADVPFFLQGGAARVRGIGEQIEPIGGWPTLRLVIAIPPVAVATPWAFRTYAAMVHPAGGDEPARLATGAAPTQALMVNDLERAVLPAYPAIAALKTSLLEAGAAAAVMSGSGSAVIALARDADDGERIAAAVRRRHPDARVNAVGAHTGPSPEGTARSR